MFHPANLHIISQSMRKHIVITSLIFEHLSCVCTQCKGENGSQNVIETDTEFEKMLLVFYIFWKNRFSSNWMKPLVHKLELFKVYYNQVSP